MGMAAVNVAIPDLAADLQANANKVAWLPTIYLLSNVAFMLPAGKLADMYGRKKVYTLGLIFTALTSILCGFASSIDEVLLWRFLQGIAGAMIFGTGIAIVSSVTPSERRGRALGIVAAFVYVGLTIAPAIGGWLTEHWGWQAVFYFQAPPMLALALFMLLKLPGEWKSSKQERFDIGGTLLFIAFSFALVLGLSQLNSFSGALLMAGAVLSLLAFIMHQRRREHPLIRVQLFKESRIFSLSLTTSFFMYGSNFAVAFLMSLYLQYVKGLSPSHAGQVLLLQAMAMALVAPFAGRLADKFEPRILATLGCIIVGVGFVLLSQINVLTSTFVISAALIAMGAGFGLFSTPNNNAIMGAVDEKEVGVASASMNLSRTIGNLFGMSIVNLIIQSMIGAQALASANAEDIVEALSFAFGLSLLGVIIAAITSSVRGRKTSVQPDE